MKRFSSIKNNLIAFSFSGILLVACAPGMKAVTLDNSTTTRISLQSQNISTCGAISSDSCQAFQLTNSQRTQNGLPAFSYCKRCSAMALEQVMDMAQRNYFSHDRPAADDRPAELFAARAARFQFSGGGENIASGTTPQGALTLWMGSAGHRANILNSSFVSMGMADFNGLTAQVFSMATDNTEELPQFLLSKNSSYGTFDWSFKYDQDQFFFKMTGVESGAIACIEAYIPSRGQNDSGCRTQPLNWTQHQGIILAQNTDWSPYQADNTYVYGTSNPQLRTFLTNPSVPNAFGRYKMYVKNRVQDPATIVMFEIQPGVIATTTTTNVPTPTTLLTGPINTQDRNVVINAYQSRYLAPEPDMGWTGNTANCVAGTTSLAYQQRVIDQINYYRNMVGLNSVTMTPNEAGYQEAALMMAANGQLNHSPPSSWTCYTASGAGGAGSSNLALGTNGIGAINLYIDDWGSNNYSVGHRRWVLNPGTGTFATGDVPGSNSLAVWLGGGAGSPMPASGFVAWPSAGYFPAQNLPSMSSRWSFSTPAGGFSTSSLVTMRNVTDNISYAVTLEQPFGGYGEPTLVWVPKNFNPNTSSRDVTIQVNVSNVNVNGVMKSYSYNVILVNAQ